MDCVYGCQVLSFLLLLPVAGVAEGLKFMKVWDKAATSVGPKLLGQNLLLSGLFHYLNNEVRPLANVVKCHPGVPLRASRPNCRILFVQSHGVMYTGDVPRARQCAPSHAGSGQHGEARLHHRGQSGMCYLWPRSQ